jgi:hypothetical protein
LTAAAPQELAILDAQTLQDIASIKLPHRVPAGFHGNWIPSVIYFGLKKSVLSDRVPEFLPELREQDDAGQAIKASRR